MADWSKVGQKDVVKAIELFFKDNPEYPEPRNTFLIYDGKKLPAKHIRGMAYKIATGQTIGKDEYSGGMETVRFFKKLGFDVAYTSTKKTTDVNAVKKNDDTKPKTPALPMEVKTSTAYKHEENAKSKPALIKIPSKGVVEQKNALQLLLNKMFNGDVVCEKTFNWMRTPLEITSEYEALYSALYNYRGCNSFAKKDISLRCDFVSETNKLIIEYDERQHFSLARKAALESYIDVPLCFDRQLWIKACDDIQAKDNSPKDRDEIRAYYDSIRDIEAAKHGYKLVRIMHGQIDFESDDAYQSLTALLTNYENALEFSEKQALKVGMYLQTNSYCNNQAFKQAIDDIKSDNIDLLVFPEMCFVPFVREIQESNITEEKDFNKIISYCIDLSKKANCAVVVSGRDSYGLIFSIYANAFNDEKIGEERVATYFKHTMTDCSAFDFGNYNELAQDMFWPVTLKGYRIGFSICYDCNHGIFNAAYGVAGVDLMVNSTGGDVIFDKWYKYNKARAIENRSFNLVTMGGDDTLAQRKYFTYGFDKNGGEALPTRINPAGDGKDAGSIFVYEVTHDEGIGTKERSLDQKESINANTDLEIPVGHVSELLKGSFKVAEHLYVCRIKDDNLVVAVLNDKDIIYPEKVLSLLYHEKLKQYKNKRYIILNRYNGLSKEMYENWISVILKVRAMENYCAVILESDLINKCYQCGQNRTAQVIKPVNGKYGLDYKRMTGPEAIWKNKEGMRASWRPNFEWLIKQVNEWSEEYSK